MTHTEIVNFFLQNNLKKDALVKIETHNGETIEGHLSDPRVHGDDINGTVENSRIGVIRTDNPAIRGIQPTPIPSAVIKNMTIIEP
jgi:hypothetical protein